MWSVILQFYFAWDLNFRKMFIASVFCGVELKKGRSTTARKAFWITLLNSVQPSHRKFKTTLINWKDEFITTGLKVQFWEGFVLRKACFRCDVEASWAGWYCLLRSCFLSTGMMKASDYRIVPCSTFHFLAWFSCELSAIHKPTKRLCRLKQRYDN